VVVADGVHVGGVGVVDGVALLVLRDSPAIVNTTLVSVLVLCSLF
jgi:hypothetical protein